MHAEERLSIPLDAALNALRKNAAINRNDSWRIILGVVLVGAFVGAALLETDGDIADHISKLVSSGYHFLILPIALLSVLITRIVTARKLLQFYENCEKPYFALDAQGMTIPIILMPYKSAVTDCLMNDRAFYLKVAWKDITAWKVGDLSENKHIMQRPKPVYRLTVMNLPTGYGTEITIKRDMLGTQDHRVSALAKRFLSIPISRLEQDKIVVNKKQIRWAVCIVGSFVLFYAALLFYGSYY